MSVRPAARWWSPSERAAVSDVRRPRASEAGPRQSFQAGFWEESASPRGSAGAALLSAIAATVLFLIAGFIVQAVVFGAGHAPYPNQPSCASRRALSSRQSASGSISCISGSSGIILHFCFDVVWFALPIFLANAPGVWVQRVMVVAMTLVPFGIVLWRRIQAGHWSDSLSIRSQRGMGAASRDRASISGVGPAAAAGVRSTAEDGVARSGAAGLIDSARPRSRSRAAAAA